MRVRWVVYAMELAALVGAYVLIGIAFGWIIGLVMGIGFIVFVAIAWTLATLLKRKGTVS